MHFYSGIISPSSIESEKSSVDDLNVASVDPTAYGPARRVPLVVDAEIYLANNPSFTVIKLDS